MNIIVYNIDSERNKKCIGFTIMYNFKLVLNNELFLFLCMYAKMLFE